MGEYRHQGVVDFKNELYNTWLELGNEGTPDDFINSVTLPGKNAFDLWKEIEGNENKTYEEYRSDVKGIQGDKGDKGDVGQGIFDWWLSQPGNENKTAQDFMTVINEYQIPINVQHQTDVDGNVIPTDAVDGGCYEMGQLAELNIPDSLPNGSEISIYPAADLSEADMAAVFHFNTTPVMGDDVESSYNYDFNEGIRMRKINNTFGWSFQ